MAKIVKTKKKSTEKEDIDKLKNQLARALADYDNLRKRIEKEKDEFVVIANIKLIMKLLPVWDMLYEAQEHVKDSGIEITLKEFEEVFKEEGVSKIDAGKGNLFDEKVHEAVEVVKGKGKKGVIVDEMLTGWQYENGMVIRPAKVKVVG